MERQLTKIVSDLADEYSQEFMDGSKVGMCGIASAALFQANYACLRRLHEDEWFAENGVFLVLGRTEFNRYHCWVETLNSKSLQVHDPTFGQFSKDFPKYWCGEETDIHKEYLHRVDVTNLEMFFTWRDDQKPTQKSIDWFLERIFTKDQKWRKYSEFNNRYWNKSEFYTFRYQ